MKYQLIMLCLISALWTQALAAEVVTISGTGLQRDFADSYDLPELPDEFTSSKTFPVIEARFVVPSFDESLGSLTSTRVDLFGGIEGVGTWTAVGDPTESFARVILRTVTNYEIFKNGVLVESDTTNEVSNNGCLVGVCTADAGPGMVFGLLDRDAESGDVFDVVMAISYSSAFSPSEFNTFVSSFGLELSAMIYPTYRYEFALKPVPLPPALWLFLSAIGFFTLNIRPTKRLER